MAERQNTLWKILIRGAVVWFLTCGVIILQIAPHFPATTLKWALLLAFGPPLYVFGEILGAWVFSPERGLKLSRKSFSVFRIIYALFIVLLVIAGGGTILRIMQIGL